MNVFRTISVLFYLLLFAFVSVMGQEHYVQSFSMVDGLPGNSVNGMFQDSRGIVWLATDAGLYQFNGTQVIYRKSLSKLQGEQINTVCEDRDGNLIVSVRGRRLFKYTGDSIKELNSSLWDFKAEVNCLVTNSKAGEIFIGTAKGLFSMSNSNNKLLKAEISKFENVNVTHLRKKENGVTVFSPQSISDISSSPSDSKKIPIVSFTSKSENLEESLNSYNQVYLSVDGKLIKSDILDCLQNEQETYCLLRYTMKGKEYRKVVQYSQGRFRDFSKRNHIDDLFVQCIFARIGETDLWIGTRNNGLRCIRKSIFSYYDVEADNTPIRDILFDNGNRAYLAFAKSLVVFGNKSLIKKIDKEQFCLATGKNKTCNKELDIWDIEFRDSNKLWIATNKGFFELDKNSLRLSFRGITRATNFTFTPDKGLLTYWNNQLAYFSLGSSSERKNIYQFEESNIVEVSNMVSHPSGVWVSTKQNGIVKFHNDNFVVYNRKNSGIHDVVNDISVLEDSTIIAGGNNGVIYKIKEESGKLKILDSLNHSNGLIGTSVHGFRYLNDGSLWCGTNLGIHRVDYNEWDKTGVSNFLYWNSLDGYFDQAGKKSTVDKKGNIWVQTRGRIIKINTASSEHRRHVCHVNIEKVDVQDQEDEASFIDSDKWTKLPTDPITLAHNQNSVTFTFGFDFCPNPSNIRIRYKLDGLDNSWSEWGTQKEAVYTNLPSGEYTLYYQSKHLSDGIITGNSHVLEIITPWWQSLWFYFALLIVVFWLIIIGFKWYALKIRKEEKSRSKQFRRVIGMKIQALQNQLDPHFVFNSLNSIQSFILEDKPEEALEYLSDFSMVLRKNIDNANRNFIKLSDEISYLNNYLKLEQMRFSDRFDFKILVDENINPLKVKVPPMLIQPFVENAIKYGLSGLDTKGELSLKFVLVDGDYMKCVIKDNGIGRKRAKSMHDGGHIQEQHKTLKITRDRMKLLNKVISGTNRFEYKIDDLQNGKGPVGTKVEIGFPNIS